MHPTPRGRPQPPHPMLQTGRHRCFRKGVWGGLWCDPEAHSPVGRGPTQVGLGQGDSGAQKEEHCLPACLSCAPPRPEVTEYHLGSETEARLGDRSGTGSPPQPLAAVHLVREPSEVLGPRAADRTPTWTGRGHSATLSARPRAHLASLLRTGLRLSWGSESGPPSPGRAGPRVRRALRPGSAPGPTSPEKGRAGRKGHVSVLLG